MARRTEHLAARCRLPISSHGKGNGTTDNDGDNILGDDDDGNVQRVITTTTMAMDNDDGDGVMNGG